MEISSLVSDIQSLLTQRGWVTPDVAAELERAVGRRFKEQFAPREGPPTLRLSQMGPRCPCALWHSIHHPELAEPLPPWAEFKYSFGHIIEAQAIMLAKAAGHEVTGEQDELYLDDIRGHRDCVIDGCIVDVKSASSFGFKKFKDKTIAEDDPFGYLDQLDGYLAASADDPLVRVKDKAYILGIDKQLGHMCLYEHSHTPSRKEQIARRIRDQKAIVALREPPACECGTVPDGKSGNVRLDTKGSYSAFKYCCKPNLRTFLYATGPIYLTEVKRKPDVPEIDKNGKFVYRLN